MMRRLNGRALLCLFAALTMPVLGHQASAADARDAALIMDGVTGRVLYSRNAEAPRYPASLTKMMTLYLLFDAIEKKRLDFDTQIMASPHAAAQTPTKLGVAVGQSITIDTAVRALAVRSANDVAVMVAETLGGTEENFAEMMTTAARSLGMEDTTFGNASGLPDRGQITTARDMALLGQRLAYDFPQHYHYLALDEFRYNGRRYTGHNNVTRDYEGADGIKTGYIRLSGFNLVTSAFRDNTHLIGVVMGGRTANERDREMVRLLDDSFEKAARDRTYAAYANVPWRDDPGRKTSAFYRRPDIVSMLPERFIVPRAKPGSSLYAEATDNDARLTEARLSSSPFSTFRGFVSDNRTESVAAISANSEQCNRQEDYCPRLVELKSALSNDASKTEALVELIPIQDGQSSAPRLDQTWVVHLGIFPNEELAFSQLNHTEITVPIDDPEKFIEPFTAESGRQYYRARLGYFEEGDARTVCLSLSEKGLSCTPEEISF